MSRMSEKSIARYRNKFLVWKSLHPEYRCRHAPSEGLCKFCRYDRESKACDHYFALHYEFKTGKLLFSNSYGMNAVEYLCLEWIKNV